MGFKVRAGNNRKLPELVGDPKKDTETLRKFLDLVLGDVNRNVTDIAKAMGGDARNTLTVVSMGPGKEIEVPHNLGIRPTRWKVVSQDGDGNLRKSKGNLGDKSAVYFRTNADEGVEFIIELA